MIFKSEPQVVDSILESLKAHHKDWNIFKHKNGFGYSGVILNHNRIDLGLELFDDFSVGVTLSNVPTPHQLLSGSKRICISEKNQKRLRKQVKQTYKLLTKDAALQAKKDLQAEKEERERYTVSIENHIVDEVEKIVLPGKFYNDL